MGIKEKFEAVISGAGNALSKTWKFFNKNYLIIIVIIIVVTISTHIIMDIISDNNNEVVHKKEIVDLSFVPRGIIISKVGVKGTYDSTMIELPKTLRYDYFDIGIFDPYRNVVFVFTIPKEVQLLFRVGEIWDSPIPKNKKNDNKKPTKTKKKDPNVKYT